MNSISYVAISLHLLVEAALIVRVIIRPHRQPASRIAWIVVIVTLPITLRAATRLGMTYTLPEGFER